MNTDGGAIDGLPLHKRYNCGSSEVIRSWLAYARNALDIY